MFHFTTALLDMYLWSYLYLSCSNGKNGNTPESIKCSYIHSQSECCKCVRFWLIDARSRLHTMYATLRTWLLPSSFLSNKQDVCTSFTYTWIFSRVLKSCWANSLNRLFFCLKKMTSAIYGLFFYFVLGQQLQKGSCLEACLWSVPWN